MATTSETKQTTFDTKGIQYVFAYKSNERWIFPRYRFQLANTDTDKVHGQFVRDIWYRAEHKITSNIEFLVVGIKGEFNYNTITSLINGSFMSYSKNRLSDYERVNNICFKDYYCLTDKNCVNYYNNNKHLSIEDSSELELIGENFKSRLIINTRFHNECIYVTTPTFIKEKTNKDQKWLDCLIYDDLNKQLKETTKTKYDFNNLNEKTNINKK